MKRNIINEKMYRRYTQENQNKERGITLIALIITIIVMMILVGVTINVMVNSNLIGSAKNAGTDWQAAAKNEEQIGESITIGDQTLTEYIESIQNGSNPKIGKKVTETCTYTDLNGDKAVIPAGFTISKIAGETTIANGLVIYDINDTNAVDWTDVVGLQQRYNQFVWISVPNDGTGPNYSAVSSATDYTNIANALKNYTSDYYNENYEDKNCSYTGLTDEEYNTLYHKMLTSVYKNGGFWIGRYEAGTATARVSSDDDLTTPLITRDAYPYNWIGSREVPVELSLDFKTDDYDSSLLFGIQWYLVFKYLEINGQEIGTTTTERKNAINEDCTNWGNVMDAEFAISRGKKYCWTENGMKWKDYDYEYAEDNGVYSVYSPTKSNVKVGRCRNIINYWCDR